MTQPQQSILTHMYAHTHTQTHIHISAYTCTTIYTCTQHAHNMHTHKQNNMQHIEQDRETNTQNSTQRTLVQPQHTSYISVTYKLHTPQHMCSTYDLHTYSYDFYHLQQYIKKLYNTAIYQSYTFCSPYL